MFHGLSKGVAMNTNLRMGIDSIGASNIFDFLEFLQFIRLNPAILDIDATRQWKPKQATELGSKLEPLRVQSSLWREIGLLNSQLEAKMKAVNNYFRGEAYWLPRRPDDHGAIFSELEVLSNASCLYLESASRND